ncbi:hypothetical protein NQ318_022346 [Aromia moschata]|uniref:DNA 3'-5' helicase n=1 Tax=Aromia moschata TaxID=1265417 RepID=A0AAV8Z4I5_9CUCU|nr:hypothetical protein NQ318_022346 [Aromia moschata]
MTKFEKMVGCGQPIESNLHRHLIEHVNAEVVLRTITDLDVAMQWLASTFLYVRARKNPRHYGLNTGLNKDQIDKKLLEICQIDLNKLVKAGMLTMDENIIITPTKTGEIMAKFYVAFETMKLFTQISGTEIMIQILDLISRCQEFSEIRLRVNDKKTLNLLNKNSKKNTIRFPINGKIKTWNMKVNCIIQAVLGNLEISDHSILGDCYIIMRNGQRIAKCLVEYLEIRKLNCYNALYNTIILCKCLHARLWENSPYISKQLSGIGSVMSHQLANAGKTTFQQILDSNPRSLEMIIKRKNPMGNTLIDEVRRLPIYEMVLEEVNKGKELKLSVTLINVGDLVEKPTVNINSTMTLMVGNNLNEILIYEKYRHAYMIQNLTVEKSIELRPEYTEIHAHFISNDWVGIDCSSTVLFQDTDTSNRKETSKEKSKEKKGSTYIQMFLDMYMKSKKKVTKNEKSKSKVSNHDKREEIEVKEDSEQRISKKFSEDSREEQRGATLNGFVEDEKTKIPPKKIGQMKRSVEPEERKGSIEISNDVMDIAEYSVEDPAIEICDGAETKNEDVTSELVEIPKETAQQKDYYETEDYEEEENAGGINAESVLTADEDVMMVESDAAHLEPVGTKATEESNQIGYQNECTDTVSNASTSSLSSNGLSTSVFAEHVSKVHDQAMEEMKSVQSDREGADEEKSFFIASQEKQEVPRNVGRAGTDEKPKYASLDFDEKLAKYPSIFRMTQSYITDEYATDDRDVKAETSKNNNKRRKNDFHLAVKVMDSKEDAKKRQKLAEFKFPSKKKFSHRPNPQAPSDSTPDGKMYAITEIMELGARRSPSESNDFETSSDAEVRDERRAENAHRSITWRSPLVFSPPVKFSPKMGFRRGSLGVDRDDGQNANINETLETSVSSKGTSNLTINIQRTPKSRRTNTTTLGRSPTMSFPLCDREYNQARASNNDKSEDTSKNDPLDICSNSFLEKMGLPRNNQSKTTPRSAGRSSGVSDYYSQFLYQPIRSQKQPNTKQEKEDVPSESVSQRAPSRGGDKEIEPQKRATDRHRLEPSRQTADEPRGQSPRDFILAQNRPLWYRPRSQRPDNLNRTLDEFTEPVQNFRVDEFATFGYPYNFDSGYPQNPASHVSSRSARPSRLNETITSGSYEASCNCLQPHCHLAAKKICGRACAEADNFRPRPLNTNNFRLDESISFPNEQPLYYLDAQPNYGFPKREMCDDYLNRTMRAEWYPEEGYLRERQNLPRRANYQDRFVDESNTVHPPYYRPIPRRIDEQNLLSTSQRFAQQPLRNYPAPDNGMPNREVVARGQNFEEPLDDGVVGRLTRSLSFEENPGLTSERLQQQEMNDRICRMQRHDTFVERNVGFPQEWGDRNRHGLCYGPSQDFYNENLPPSGWGYPQEFHGNRDYNVFPSSNDKEYVMNKFFLFVKPRLILRVVFDFCSLRIRSNLF